MGIPCEQRVGVKVSGTRSCTGLRVDWEGGSVTASFLFSSWEAFHDFCALSLAHEAGFAPGKVSLARHWACASVATRPPTG